MVLRPAFLPSERDEEIAPPQRFLHGSPKGLRYF